MNWSDILKRGMAPQYVNLIDEIMSDGKERSVRQLMGDLIEYKNHPDYLTAKRIKHRSRAHIPTRKEFSVHMQVMTSRGKYERVGNRSPYVYRKVEEEE